VPRQAKPRVHVVLLAGGSGTRFWPLSRFDRPKQFLPLAGKRSLLELTRQRVRGLAPPARVWAVAPARLADAVRRELPDLRPGNLIVEPSPRDTAPAIALACATVQRVDPDATVGVFPTDHLISDRRAFVTAVRAAAASAAEGALVCLGVRPDHPATGYGYLKCGPARKGRADRAVERFVEKPDRARAKRYLASGRYLWNAGMFVWRADRFLAELGRVAPEILSAVRGHLEGRKRSWARAPRRSVDYAVMERAKAVRVVPLRAGWDDVGSWDAAARHRESRTAERDGSIRIDSPGTVVYGDRRVVAVVDLPDVVVVDTDDALLLVSRKSSEKVKEVVRELNRRGREELL
jgi:mannose-1-phosphate guanylyltransferase/mannose-6-phosphate isomerase